MATGGESALTPDSGVDLGYIIQHVYKDLIIKHVRVGSLLGRMSIPEEHDITVNNIHAYENSQQHLKATKEFLAYLDRHSDPRDYLLFVQLLEQQDYVYLPKLLRGEDTVNPETHQQHCRLLQFFSQDISEKVDFDLLHRKLIEGEWMDQEDSELLKRLAHNNGMASASKWFVYYVLPKRKENWLKQFLQILRDLEYCDLADWITGDTDENNTESDTDTLSGEDTDDTASLKMNILSASGKAYSLQNNLDASPMTYTVKRGPGRDVVGKLSQIDLQRVEEWAKTTLEIPHHKLKDFPDDVSFVSSIEDNTMLDFGEYEITHELVEARDKVIKPLENRPYQEELARAARSGRNVLIIAPTGCGKTVVALRIMQDHLEKMSDRGKVAFFANEVTLVDQQHEMVQGHLESTVRTIKITGETKDKSAVPVSDLIKIHDIVFMTPQIVVDALANKSLESLSVFTMLLFDECHHVLSKHPTNKIMCIYMDMKFGGATVLPQVVGLTASVGVGKKKLSAEKEGAINHIRELCARLDATGGLVTVRDNKDSLDEYTHYVETAIKTTNVRATDTFKDCIVDNIMTKIEAKMLEQRPILGHFPEDDITICSDKGTQTYKGWLSQLYYTVLPRIRDAALRKMYISCVQHLNAYNEALMINENCRARDALLVIEETFSRLYPTQRIDGGTETWLYNLYSENKHDLERQSRTDLNLNPKLLLLKLEILGQIGKKYGSKILVLVKTRNLTSALLRWMRESVELKPLSPVVVTGCGVSAYKGGMSRSEQVEAVKTFKWGKSRVAIATSVAEEGMDITQCSRVIRYEYVTDVIGMVQARGRASRVDDGTYCLITGNSMLATREENNFRLERVMNEGVETLQREFDLNPQSFFESLEQIQRKDKMNRDIEQKHGQPRPKNPDAYDLHCYKCNTFICQSTDIRVLNNSHHMVMSPSVGSLITEVTHKKPKEFDNIKKLSKIHCKKCNMDWGVGVIYKDAKFVVLSLKGLIFYDRYRKQHHRKNWKDAPFSCAELTQEDILNYEGSF